MFNSYFLFLLDFFGMGSLAVPIANFLAFFTIFFAAPGLTSLAPPKKLAFLFTSFSYG